MDHSSPLHLPNIRRFIAFRICFNARFYYPIFTVLFLDFGLTLEQFAALNVVWAATIVLLEVPSGALADTIGRRRLVVAAGAIMVVEMALLCFAPIGPSPLVFGLFLANRVLSGAAEAAASGADESLAYDSLKAAGRERDWPRVLEAQMRWQSIAFVAAMSLGGLLYDSERINALLRFVGWEANLSPETALRLPLYLTLALSLGAFAAALGMTEDRPKAVAEPGESSLASSWRAIKTSTATTLAAGKWILSTPTALAIILGGFLIDHITRMMLTLNSQYYRQIGLSEASFGVIAAAMSMLGLAMPALGRRLVESRSKGFNFCALSGLTLVSLWTTAQFFPLWGVLPMAGIYAAIFLAGYFVSHYLNAVTASEIRATALSFKGLLFNLAYGGIGLLYSWLIAYLRAGRDPDDELQAELFEKSLAWFPGYFVAMFLVVLAYGTFHRAALRT